MDASLLAADFSQLLLAVQQADPSATTLFVNRYRPFVVDHAQRLLHGAQWRAVVDASDIGQSVLRRVVTGITQRQLSFLDESKLRALLRVLVWNAVVSWARHERARGRTQQLPRELQDDSGLLQRVAIAATATGSEYAAATDLIEQVSARLDEVLKLVLQRRIEGLSWDEIAAEIGQRTHTIRVRFNRSVKRALAELTPTE